MKKQTMPGGAGRKPPFIFNLLFFISFAVFIFLVEGDTFLDGGDWQKYFESFARVLVPLAAAFYFSFYRPVVGFAHANASLAEKLIALAGAVPLGIKITIDFFNSFFMQVLNGGSSPVLVKRVFDKLNLTPNTGQALVYIGCTIMCVLSVFVTAVLLALLIHVVRITLRYTKNNPRNAWTPDKKATGKRYVIAIALSLTSGVLCMLTLNKGLDWGADYSVYMQQGFQLANGVVAGVHEAWGYSAMLAVIYAIFGYNTVDYSTLIYYKIPSVICFALIVFFLFLFFSKRFSLRWSAFLTILFGFNPNLIAFNNYIWTDIPHMLFCVVSIICIYEFLNSNETKRQIIFAVLAGINIYIANVIRAAGIALLIALLIVQVIYLLVHIWQKKKSVTCLIELPEKSKLYIQFLPYAVYVVLTLCTMLIVPYYSTGASVSRYASASVLIRNFGYYFNLLFSEFLAPFSPFHILSFSVAWVAVPLFIIGIYRSIGRDIVSVIYFCFMFISMLFVWALNGIRYTFPLLPFFVLFIAVGAKTAVIAVSKTYHLQVRLKRIIAIGALTLSVFLLVGSADDAYSNLSNNREWDRFAFSTDAIATYEYIQNETGEAAEIVFYKAPVVELNTERTSTREITRDRALEQYLLITYDPSNEHQYIPDEYATEQTLESALNLDLQIVYENDRFALYRITIIDD
jgi:hypothetical protein